MDGDSLHLTARALRFDVDYRKLLGEFRGRANVLRAFYYTAIVDNQDYSGVRPLLDWLDYNGFTVVSKPVKEFSDERGRRKFKGSMGIDLAVGVMQLSEQLDEIFLFSGDGGFSSLVRAVQRRGVRVTVVSSCSTQPTVIADELRRQADDFIDLAQLQSRIERNSGRMEEHM
ncbi:NYN domain-containing protein [Bradyrhizobium sp. CCGUVB14]|uniref:LabA-like NYN domain-containing protein n=1 Tax=Bradyrhizobium sp. CCGUVB14 TaxID=2949628 RepID=UPI0028118EFF|nr:NYN domain-containing protein [Bradyrhizobium sp. CCGUVB14]